MMTATAHKLERRPFRLDMSQELCAPGTWLEGRPFATHFLNAYTLLIPGGERFIIRSCSREMHRAEPALQDELRALFFQEGSHSREHARLVGRMDDTGLGMPWIRRALDWLSYRVCEPAAPSALRVATAAAIEHHNAVIATYFLQRDLLRGSRIAETRRLLLWHFAEEIEHKETTFKLLQRLSASRVLRAAGLAMSCATFLTYLCLLSLLLGIKTRAALTPAFWRDVFAQFRGPDGLAAMLAVESMRYVEADFVPRQEDSRPLLDAALAELERMGVERPRHQPPSSPRPVPPAFQESISSSVIRARAASNAGYGACLEGYDGVSVRVNGARKLNFCTYSYLALLDHPLIRKAAIDAIHRYGTGTHGVRLLGGNLDIHDSLERRIADFFEREAALTFSSGFMTNVAVIAALVGRDDYVLFDIRNHASIADGCRCSGAHVVNVRHNDVDDLAARLRRLPEQARKLIVVDAVFSMDGDIAPLRELIGIRDRHPNTMLMVDEAHSLGVLGHRGRGIEEHAGAVGQVDVLMGTLSKTIPAQGGYVAGSRDLITHLRYTARGFVFSAALAPPLVAAARAAFDVIEREGVMRRSKLATSVAYFLGRLHDAGFNTGATASAIIPILLGSEDLAVAMAGECSRRGIHVRPVVYPAVRRGSERLRMNVTSAHRREDLDTAVTVLSEARATLARQADQRVQCTSGRSKDSRFVVNGHVSARVDEEDAPAGVGPVKS